MSYSLLYGRRPWVSRLKGVIRSLPKGLLAKRIKSIASLNLMLEPSDIPALYIRPTHDHLVSRKQADDWLAFLPNIRFLAVDGPHFILQANPSDCAEAILRN